MSAITAASISTDQAKMLASRLIQRSMLKMVAASLCDKVPMEHGAGLTAFFVRYKRMNVPVTVLTEGTDPSSSSFTVDGVNVTLDQWGDLLNVTDIALLATKHDVVRQVLDLLSDNAQRVIDREVQIVWLSGTNILFGDGSVSARSSITATMRLTDGLITQAVVNLSDQGAPPRGGPTGVRVESSGDLRMGSAYAAVAGPHVIGEIRQPGTVLGSWVSVMMYNDPKNLYNAEVGTWLGIRWIESNFIPKFTLFGSGTVAVTSTNSFGTGTPTVTTATTGGALLDGDTFFWKITRKDLLRGFEEAISIAHSTAATSSANTNKFTFAMPATAGFVYNVYFDTVTTGGTGTDATLGLVTANAAASASVVVTANPAATTNPPANIISDGTVTTVHPVYIHADESCNWVGLQNLEFMQTPDQALPGNLLKLNRWFSYKFMAKTMIRDQTRILRLEVASIYG